MRCDEFMGVLNEYLDGQTQSALCQALKEHLVHCNSCRIVIDNIRQTISLYRAGQPVPLPPELHERLHAILQERWAAQSKGNRS